MSQQDDEDQLAKTAVHRQQEEELRHRLAGALADVDTARKQAAEIGWQARRDKDRFMAWVGDLQLEVEAAWRERAAALARLAEAEARAQRFQNELEKAFASRSWKLTRPLRAFNERNQARAKTVASPEAQTQPISQPAFSVPLGKEPWDEYGRVRLKHLLGTDRRLQFQAPANPEISIVLVFFNCAHLSLLCLESILANACISYEIVIVDNGSTDDTSRLLERLDGVRIIRNSGNRGFGEACMQGVEVCKGTYLCFLNNDALLEPATLAVAIDNFKGDPRVGAVGGKLLFADGSLQEAGSILWSDGSAWGYGRGDDSHLPQYEFRRPVDYCSAAFLITPTELFRKLGGFSARFFPAYYEDSDYCTSLWANDFRVIYEPQAVVRHFESASSGGSESAKSLITDHRERYTSKWRDVLTKHLPKSSANVQRGRIAASSGGLRVLYLDDEIPHYRLGSGFPRSNAILRQLVRADHLVSCASMLSTPELDYSDISRNVEIVDAYGKIDQVLDDYLRAVDIVWVSRPHNMNSLLQGIISKGIDSNVKIIYDAQANFAELARLKAQVLDKKPQEEILDAWRQRELALAEAADAVVCVSNRDLESMHQHGIKNVHVVGYGVDAAATAAPFEHRNSFLFIGAMHGLDDPNTDSMLHFCSAVWPLLQRRTGAPLIIAGHGTDKMRSSFQLSGAEVLGPQEELTALYERARVFLVPTRYSAGVPFKAVHAAAHGVPLVVSSLVGRQLGWTHDQECLIADDAYTFAENCFRLYSDAALWERLRSAALKRVEQEFTQEKFGGAIERVIAFVCVETKKNAG